MFFCAGNKFETDLGIERLTLRPVGRRCTTVAIYGAAASARRAANGLLEIGLGMDVFSIVGGLHRPGLFVDYLMRLGVSRAGAQNYEASVEEGRALLIVHGKLVDTCRAASMLARTACLGLAEYRG